ncbi:MAG: hypothetical protein KJ600_00655 [Nanoarchaeota archaeon]|nr:hypothetical protein [Nanoarchaeota archaeon]
MAKKRKGNLLGSWSFLIGVILALVFGLFVGMDSRITYVLVVLGIIVGLLNINDEEAGPFLMAGTVLVIVSALGQVVVAMVPPFQVTLQALAVLFVPATIIVALKHVFSLARG